MAVTHSTANRNAKANHEDDQVNAGSAGASQLAVRQGTTDLVVFSLLNPAFGTAPNPTTGRITLNGTPIGPVSAVASGDADNYQVRDRDGNMTHQGAVTPEGGGGQITAVNVSININQQVNLISYYYEAAP
jgi:hypothetical protein